MYKLMIIAALTIATVVIEPEANGKAGYGSYGGGFGRGFSRGFDGGRSFISHHRNRTRSAKVNAEAVDVAYTELRTSASGLYPQYPGAYAENNRKSRIISRINLSILPNISVDLESGPAAPFPYYGYGHALVKRSADAEAGYGGYGGGYVGGFGRSYGGYRRGGYHKRSADAEAGYGGYGRTYGGYGV